MRQFLTFAIIGAVGTGGHYLTLIALVEAAGLNPVLATTAGFVVGAVINYILNYHITFRSNKSHREAMTKFFSIAVVGAMANSGLVYLGIELGLHYLLAQIVATGLVLIINFVLNKRWTFA